MAYTVAERNALKAALATGALRVTHEGHSVEFRSRDDMRKQLAEMEAELAAAGLIEAAEPPIRRLRYLHTKGLW